MNNLKRTLHREYCLDLYEINFKDSKKLWAVTNKLLKRKSKGGQTQKKVTFKHKGSLLEEDAQIADKFNEYFVNIGQKLVDSFQTTENFKEHLPKSGNQQFRLKDISQEDLMFTIRKLINRLRF